ncbi:hypothetical protein FQA39_LY15583 [Lamprigera yunnana]|nr:hypothetical protein FQA39_LY15583 [Lamprigera yunnana]
MGTKDAGEQKDKGVAEENTEREGAVGGFPGKSTEEFPLFSSAKLMFKKRNMFQRHGSVREVRRKVVKLYAMKQTKTKGEPEERKTKAIYTEKEKKEKYAIKEDDIVSKRVCRRCCEIAVQLYKYRAKAMKNDKLLKEHKSEEIKRHLSVVKLMKENKGIAIPKQVVSQDVLPVVTLDEDEVNNWYKQKHLQNEEKLSNITITSVSATNCLKSPINEVFSLPEKVKIVEGNSVKSTPPLNRIKINVVLGKLTSTLVPVEPLNKKYNEYDLNKKIRASPINVKDNLINSVSMSISNKDHNNESVSTNGMLQKYCKQIDSNALIMKSPEYFRKFICKLCSVECSTETLLLEHQKRYCKYRPCQKMSRRISIDHLNKSPIKLKEKSPAVDSMPSIRETHQNSQYRSSSNGNNGESFTSAIREPRRLNGVDDVNTEISTLVGSITSYQGINEIIYVSDDSDTESMSANQESSAIECVDLTESDSTEFDNFYSLSKQFYQDDRVIENLFSRNLKVDLSENYTQSFNHISQNIKCIDTNSYLFTDLLLELEKYCVPTELVIHSNLCAKYSSKSLYKKMHAGIEWDYKMATDVELSKEKIFENTLLRYNRNT